MHKVYGLYTRKAGTHIMLETKNFSMRLVGRVDKIFWEVCERR